MRFRAIATAAVAALAFTVGSGSAIAHSPHEVLRGDTLSEIASDHNTTWQSIFRANTDKISDPDLIFPGQKFVTPSGGKQKARPAAVSSLANTVRPATGQVTSSYGMRTHPITGIYKLHSGTDFAYGDGNVYAAKAGVVSIEYPSWAGILVVIDHGGGVVTQYAHMASVKVSSGQKVGTGQTIGKIGARGLATGAHLHFEVLIDGQYVNPMGWLE